MGKAIAALYAREGARVVVPERVSLGEYFNFN